MLENITIDNVLKKYYHVLPEDNLNDDNIVIDETPVEDSVNKYIVEFCKFLRASYNRGYYISESIFSKLMSVIDYEDYAYQVFMGYKAVLENAMNDYVTVHKYKAEELPVEESIKFINEYLSIIKDPDFEPETFMYILHTTKFPTGHIYNVLKDYDYLDTEMKLISLYILYKEDPKLYNELVKLDILNK